MSVAAELRTRPRTWHITDAGILAGSGVSSFALVWLAYYRLAPLNGVLGFLICWFVAFTSMYWLVERELNGKLEATDKVVAVVVAIGSMALLIPLALIIGYVVVEGMKALTPTFFTETLEFVGPLDPATAGGAAHAIVGTLQQVAIAAIISVPLGVMTAVFLNEVGGPFARPVRLFVDAMSGVPSIVAGLFIYSVLLVQFDFKFSGLAAGLALSILMLPTITRTSEEVLRLVPDGLREASLALGAPEWRTTWGVVLPTARPGLVTAVILGVARAVGETAPLIMTSFGASVMNANPFSAPQESLPLFIYNQIRRPQEAEIDKAWTAALVLIGLVLFLFVLARLLGRTKVGQPKRRLRSRFRKTKPTR